MSEDFIRWDAEAERAVIGGSLLDNEAIARIASIVKPADFYSPANAIVFEGVLSLHRRMQPVDVITLANELRSMERLQTIGGGQYLGELTDTIPTIAHIEEHARIVADLAAGRAILSAAMSIVQAARDPGRTTSDLRTMMNERVIALSADERAGGPQSFGDLAEKFYSRLEAISSRGPGIDGITTGLHDLDEVLAGLHGGDLIVIGARPRMGKSSLVMQMLVAAARERNEPALCFSPEMSALALFTRAVCSNAGVDSTGLRKGVLTREDFEAITIAVNELSTLPVYIDDASSVTSADVRTRSVAMKSRRGLALVACDYLQLFKTNTTTKNATREREVAEVSTSAKELARELEIPVIMLSQLNRGVENRPDKRPQLHDLRDTSQLEQDADVVIFLYRDVLYNPNTSDRDIAEIIVAKQRNGPAETVRTKWEGVYTRFADLERDAEDPGHGPSPYGRGVEYTPDDDMAPLAPHEEF